MRFKRSFPVVSVLALLLVAMFLVPSIRPIIPSVEGASTTIYLIGTLVGGYTYYWNNTNPTITVTQGDTITIILSSADTTPHRFLLDLDKDGVSDTADCSATPTLNVDPCSTTFSTTSTMVRFTAGSQGTFSYYCTIHYPAMTGSFKVQAPTAPTFSISSNPTSLTFQQGSSSTSTITLTGQNGFSGTVNLLANTSPNGLTASLKPPSVTISPGTPQTSILSVNSTTSTPSGSYTVTVTGTSGSIMNPTTIGVTINPQPSQNFGLAISPTSVTVAQGSTGTTTISITSVNGFTGTVNLAGTVSPSGPTVSFNPATVSVSPGYPGSSTMTVSAVGGLYTSVANGSYSVNVTATSGSLAHSTAVPVIVGSSNSTPSAPLSIPPTVLVGIVVAIIAAVAVTIFLVRRKPASK